MKVERCRSRNCRAAIVWLPTSTGKSMPVDRESLPAELPDELVFDPKAGHVSHFATCPDAKRWRKPR